MILADEFRMNKSAGQPKKGAGGKRGKKTKLTPELTAATAELSKAGNNNAEIAAALGISEASLYEYRKLNPEFAEALKRGRTFAVVVAEGRLFKRACGYELVKHRRKYGRVSETVGKKTVFKRVLLEEVVEPHHVPPDPTSLALFLNNNAPERYSRKPEDKQAAPAVVLFQFNVVEVDGTKKVIDWDPRKPLPAEVLPQEPN